MIKNTVLQNRNPKRARHDAKNPIFNKQSINIAYWNVHGLYPVSNKIKLTLSGRDFQLSGNYLMRMIKPFHLKHEETILTLICLTGVMSLSSCLYRI